MRILFYNQRFNRIYILKNFRHHTQESVANGIVRIKIIYDFTIQDPDLIFIGVL